MGYSTDTRTLKPGDIFVAIRGERHDGHDFVPDALGKGATGAVVERSLAGLPHGMPVTIVEDSERYLCGLAAERVRQTRSQIIAITGSVGKTTTKNAVSTVLRKRHWVLSTPGNFNTPLGIALTILNATLLSGARLVLEMGATRRGDIAHLCTYFPPDVSVVTNVFGVHLSSFGSLEAVVDAKSEIVQALTKDGVACLNHDALRVRGMAGLNGGQTIFFGRGAACQVRPEHITASIPLLGDHVPAIAMAAMAVGRTQGLSDVEINLQLEQLVPERGRLNRLSGVDGCTLIDDTYNASPRSAEVALSVLRGIPAQRRIAFLGDMLELGPPSAAAHEHIVRLAGMVSDQVITVGPLMGALADSAGRKHFRNSEDVVRALGMTEVYRPRDGDVVLVKGSQGVRMERISKALLHPGLDPDAVLVRQNFAWTQV